MQGFDFKEIQEKISNSFRPWPRSFQFWVRATNIYTGYKVPTVYRLELRCCSHRRFTVLLVAINLSHRNHHCRVISAAARARLLRSSSHSPRALNRAGHTFTHRSIGSLGCSVRRLDQARWIEHLSSTSNVPNHETYMVKF
ncbi:hypothetical protein Bca52824_042145 [Brassica carinata]|uniref:Uncharacterized protein n=1 Tax=Brassica carinata TaxID=52824 RepID=A0A8X7V0M5_BRACI|nr:hypothetical protein Bca52824_042145 [Brassica carinata]